MSVAARSRRCVPHATRNGDDTGVVSLGRILRLCAYWTLVLTLLDVCSIFSSGSGSPSKWTSSRGFFNLTHVAPLSVCRRPSASARKPSARLYEG